MKTQLVWNKKIIRARLLPLVDATAFTFDVLSALPLTKRRLSAEHATLNKTTISIVCEHL
jgi:hypothetical protein